ncbi:hypothetical protein ACOSP7_022629 [Xanthoceras sorbifolium]
MNSEPALYLLIGKKGLSKERPERNEVVLNERVVLNAPFLAVVGSAEGSGSEAEANSTKRQDKSVPASFSVPDSIFTFPE